jgi:predicted secreted protein
MTSTAIPGRLAKLVISDDGGATYHNVGGVVDINMNINVDELEVTSHDSNGAREYIPNHHDVTLDISGRWQDSDPGQEMLMTSTFQKTQVMFKLTFDSVTGHKLFTGSCFVTSSSPSGPLDDAASMDFSLRCSGVQMGAQP